jgi:hypothetical protein
LKSLVRASGLARFSFEDEAGVEKRIDFIEIGIEIGLARFSFYSAKL